MKTDVAGRVRNIHLPPSKPLYPLFEAVVNSIQSIQNSKRPGSIVIEVLRAAHLFRDSQPEVGPISGFRITDNGSGFDEANYDSFETSDTTFKAKIGGKGIGRFLWLVAFEYVLVDSVYERDGKRLRREFRFEADGDGIKDMHVTDAAKAEITTTVELHNLRERYQETCPRRLDTIASHLIEHCLEFFIRPDCPNITLKDDAAVEALDLKELFKKEIATESSKTAVEVKDQKFTVLHVRLKSSHVRDHLLHFCADGRVAKSEKLFGRLPNLARRLQDESGADFIYAAYVDSPFLDQSVNGQRTDFSITEGEDALASEITWPNIRVAIFEACNKFLKPYTDPVGKRQKQRIEQYLEGDGAIYRPIVKYASEKIALIDPDSSNETLEQKLHEVYRQLQVEVQTEGKKLLTAEGSNGSWDEFQKEAAAYFAKVSDISKSDLARYVCHRRAVLDYLQKQLSIKEDGKYHLEERVHQVIFPKGKTSDDVSYDEHNLWVLDETLVYHSFLASDKALKSLSVIKSDSRKEPDLLVFDKALAFGVGTDGPYSSITIVEFKRPMRNDYTDSENPITQVYGYIDDIRAGTATTPEGRTLPVGKGIPFFCYVVCDITPKLKEQARAAGLIETPDGQGYFGFNQNYNAYLEVVSYSQMVIEAKKRNAVFFDKLGLPSKVTA